MQTSWYLTSVVFFLTNFLQAQTTLTFEIENAANDSCYIAYYYGDSKYIIGDDGVNDVLYLDQNGKGKFVRDNLEKGIYLIVFPPNNDYTEFIYEGGNPVFSFDRDDPVHTFQAKNAPATQFMYLDIRNTSLLRKKYPNASEDKVQEEQLSQQRKKFQDSLRRKNPDNFYLDLVEFASDPVIPDHITQKGGYEPYYYYRAHYFDKVPFDEEWIVRTPTYHSKLMTYMDRLTSMHSDSVKIAVDLILSRAKVNPVVFKYTLVTLFNKYATSKTMGHDGVYVYLAQNYYLNGVADWLDEEQTEKIRKRVDQLKNCLIGLKAQDINFKSSDGTPHSLSETNDTYTILLFSSPDCSRCKETARELNALQDSISANTEVVMIHLDTNPAEMQELITEHDYFWKNGLVTAEEARVVRSNYDLRSLPMLYVLDKSKTIIGKQISVQQAIGILNDLED